MELPRMELPKVTKVRQVLPPDHIADIVAEVRTRLEAAGIRKKLNPGQRVAITAGSRGMGGFKEILRALIDEVKSCGAQPFLIPAMGSHSGATAEGQADILEGYGITEEAMDCPIHATMDTVCLGRAENGAGVHYDRHAFDADATIVLGRCKTHPILHEGNGSGLLKMTTIWLGKQKGAQEAHSHGLTETVQVVPKVALEKGNVILGVHVVENGYRQPYHIEIVEPREFLESDQRCLEKARALVARVPFDRLDVLVISYIGKNVSGGGMDTNITSFWRAEDEGERVPDYKRIVVLDLTEQTQGNALGIGQADFTTTRLVEKIDHHATTVNMLTAASRDGRLIEAAVPITLESDREAIEVALRTAVPETPARVCWIRSTDELGELWVSEALLPEVRQNPQLEVLGEPMRWPFDETGNADWQDAAQRQEGKQ